MAATSYATDPLDEVFDMEGFGEQPFEMEEDDYGFYEDLDSDEDDALSAGLVTPLPSDEDSGLSTPLCGGRIEDADPDSLRTSPPILSPFVVDAIAEDGLPWSMQETQWDRLFSSSRDGASFGTFMRRVRGHGNTIIVAKTSDGRIVGGYATGVWSGRKQKPGSQGDDASHAFLFVVEPPAAKAKHARPATPTAHTFIPGLEELSSSPTSALDFDFHQMAISSPKARGNDKPHVEFFKPADSGFKQACQLGKKLISMSDGSGDLSLAIEDSFTCGGVARLGGEREDFEVVEFEVYGFSED